MKRVAKRTWWGIILGLLLSGVVAAYGARWRYRTTLPPSHWAHATGGQFPPQFTSQGTMVVVAGGGHAQFYKVASSELVRYWPLSPQPGYPLGFWVADDGLRAVTAFEQTSRKSGTATFSSIYTLYNAVTGHILKQGRLAGDVRQVSFESGLCLTCNHTYRHISVPGKKYPDVELLASSVRLYDLRSGRLVKQFAMPRGVHADGRLMQQGRMVFLTGDEHIPSRLVRLSDGKELLSLPATEEPSLSPDGKRILTGDGRPLGSERTIHIWNLTAHHHTAIKTNLIRLWKVFELRDGSLLVYGGKKVLHPGPDNNGIFDTVVQVRSPDGTRVLREYTGGVLQFGLAGRIGAVPVPEVAAAAGVVKKWMEDGLAKVDILDLESGTRLCRLDTARNNLGEVVENPWQFQSLAFSPDGKRAVTLAESGLLRFYDLPATSSSP